VHDGRTLGLEKRAPAAELSSQVEGDARGVVDVLVLVGVERGERVGIAGDDRGHQPCRARGRGVRPHPTLASHRGSGRPGSESLGRQLVEADERLGVAVGVEELDARHEAIGLENPEHEEHSLVGTAAGAVGAEVSPPQEECIGP
jgi:hypothetical protein